MNPSSVREIDFAALRGQRPERLFQNTGRFYPSPNAWEDQVLYFLMLDRFSDGREEGYLADGIGGATTPRFQPGDGGNAITTEADAAAWRDAGINWCGGNLRGLTAKMGYLQRLGITALWVSPLLQQAAFDPTYHGYGIQDFLTVDPHFGTAEDLQEMVAAAHANGIYVILDVILNHSGDVFGYVDGNPVWTGTQYPVAGYRDATGAPDVPFAPPPGAPPPARDAAIWPSEMQPPETFTRQGRIQNWDNWPEFLDGDFVRLKDIHLGTGPIDQYQPSAALAAMATAYKYWIAFADLDGLRLDTVKHMDDGAVRYFASVLHEFTQSLGKENFYLIGEITGGREFAFEKLEATGLDAALGVDDIPDKIEYLVKGYRNPEDYFALFRNSLLVGKDSHAWFRNKVVTLFDDHDQVRKGADKARFCAGDPAFTRQVVAALGLEATTLGIPLLYYGTEQGFDGAGGGEAADRYIRETMFGGPFGAFRSRDRHFFDEQHSVYRAVAALLEVRRRKLALRRGRQYLRQISGNGEVFGYPVMLGGQIRSVVPWSRLFDTEEVLCALNTAAEQPSAAWAIVDFDLNPSGRLFRCCFSTDATQINRTVAVEDRGGCRCLRLELAPAGFVIYEQI